MRRAAAPCVPKSSLVSTRPRPKSCSHRRLTVHARDQRVVAIDQPARQAEPVGRQRVLHRRQRQRRPRVHALAARGEGAALAQLVRRPLEAGPILHHQRARDLQIDERLARGLERVARRREQRRGAAELGGEIGAPPAVRSAAGRVSARRSGGASVAPISGSAAVVAAEPEAADALADRAVLLRDAQRHARAAREAERTRRLQHGVARQARRLAHRVDRPRAPLAIAAGVRAGAGEQIHRLERGRRRRRPGASAMSSGARRCAAGERRDRHGEAGHAEVAVGVAAGAAARQARIGQRLEAQAGQALAPSSRTSTV